MIKAILLSSPYRGKDKKQISFSANKTRLLNKLKGKYTDVNWTLLRDNLSESEVKILGKALKKLNSVHKQIQDIELPLIHNVWPYKTYLSKHWFTGKERLRVEVLHQKIRTVEQTAVFKKLSEIGPKRTKKYHFLKDGETPDIYADHFGIIKFRKD